jgi:Short-chain dehydrogenases of various substrate specificities
MHKQLISIVILCTSGFPVLNIPFSSTLHLCVWYDLNIHCTFLIPASHPFIAKNWDFKNRSCTSGVEEGVVCADELEVRATIIGDALTIDSDTDWAVSYSALSWSATRAWWGVSCCTGTSQSQFGGSLHYRRMDVRDRDGSNQVMSAIAEDKNRLDGLVVAAGVNHVGGATAHSAADIERVISTNYIGAFTSATAAVAQMLNKKTRGSILLVSSMSGLITNQGMISSIIYRRPLWSNSLEALRWNGARSIRKAEGKPVNCLSSGHIKTPIAQIVIDKTPGTKEIWESENIVGRLA